MSYCEWCKAGGRRRKATHTDSGSGVPACDEHAWTPPAPPPHQFAGAYPGATWSSAPPGRCNYRGAPGLSVCARPREDPLHLAPSVWP